MHFLNLIRGEVQGEDSQFDFRCKIICKLILHGLFEPLQNPIEAKHQKRQSTESPNMSAKDAEIQDSNRNR